MASATTRPCDKCRTAVASPGGFLLDPRTEDLERWYALSRAAAGISAAGAVFVTPQSDPYWFICQSCMAMVAGANGRPVAPAQTAMAAARARHLWTTGEWERPMLAQEFPPESEENRLPWMNPAMEAEWRTRVGASPHVNTYLAMRVDILATVLRQSARQSRSRMPNNPFVDRPVRLVALVADTYIGSSWESDLSGFTERRLLPRVAADTQLWFVPYRECTTVWFTHRMLPYLTAAIAMALADGPSDFEFECYVDNHGCRNLAVLA